MPPTAGDNEAGAAALHRLLERQHYRLAYWRVAFSAVNYRRFFDINDLAGLRVENPATFRAIHALVARLIAAGELQGLRLDHIDGLRDPAQYTRRLRQLIGKMRGSARGARAVLRRGREDPRRRTSRCRNFPASPAPPATSGSTSSRACWSTARGSIGWSAPGATSPASAATFPRMLESAKLRVIESMLASEFTVLSRALARIAAGHFSTRDFTIDRLRAALQLYVLEFPVYRTYVTAAGASAGDRQIIEDAIARARARWQGPDPEIFDFLRDAITLDLAANPATARRACAISRSSCSSSPVR